MEFVLRVTALLGYLLIGSWLAWRQVLSVRQSKAGAGQSSGVIGFVLICWLGAFLLGWVQDRISIAFFDPADFSEDQGVPAEVAHDGTGNHAFALLFGWALAPVCLGLAKLFGPKGKSQHSAAIRESGEL